MWTSRIDNLENSRANESLLLYEQSDSEYLQS